MPALPSELTSRYPSKSKADSPGPLPPPLDLGLPGASTSTSHTGKKPSSKSHTVARSIHLSSRVHHLLKVETGQLTNHFFLYLGHCRKFLEDLISLSTLHLVLKQSAARQKATSFVPSLPHAHNQQQSRAVAKILVGIPKGRRGLKRKNLKQVHPMKTSNHWT